MCLTELEKEKAIACIRYFEKHFEGEMYRAEKQLMLECGKCTQLEQEVQKLKERSNFYSQLSNKINKHLSKEHLSIKDTWTKSNDWIECQTFNIKNVVKFDDNNESEIVVPVVAENVYKALQAAKSWLLSRKAYLVKQVISQSQVNEITPKPCGNVLIVR